MNRNIPTRTDTAMGRALATRALIVADQQDATSATVTSVSIDLTTPEASLAPLHVREAAKDALDRGETHYTTRPGIAELRQAVARVAEESGFPATADSTVITNGGSEALYIALQCVVSDGDLVGVVGPVAPNVIQMIEFIGGSTSQLTGSEQSGFFPDPEEIDRLDAKVLLITTPSPISGTAWSHTSLERVLARAQQQGIAVILDRSAAGCGFVPDEERFPDANLGSYPIVVGSFSNSHGLAGWRVGYFTAPENLMGELRNLKQAMSICTTAVSQFAALAAIDGPTEWLGERRNEFQRRRDMVVSNLAKTNLPVVEGSSFPGLLINVNSIDPDDAAVVARLAQHSVRVDAGSLFGDGLQGHLRLDLGVKPDALESGVQQIAGLINERSTE